MNDEFDKGKAQARGDARPERLPPDTLEAEGEESAAVSLSDEGAADYAPLMDGFTQIIKGIETHEEVQPAVVTQPAKEK